MSQVRDEVFARGLVTVIRAAHRLNVPAKSLPRVACSSPSAAKSRRANSAGLLVLSDQPLALPHKCVVFREEITGNWHAFVPILCQPLVSLLDRFSIWAAGGASLVNGFGLPKPSSDGSSTGRNNSKVTEIPSGCCPRQS